jgi:hypothetical protein
MRNRILEVAEAAVIEDFYRGSNDSAFVRTILQKAPTTSEQLFWEADLYITADERAQDLIGGAKPAPAAPRRDTNQQPDKTLGEEASRRSSRCRTTRLSRLGRTSWRRTHAGRHPRRPVPVPQGHAPHPSELQRLQALCRAQPTLPTSTSSSAAGRTRRTATTPTIGGGRRWSLPTRRQRGQRHLRRTRIAGEQKTTKAQRSPNTGSDHRSSRSVPMVGAPDHLHPGRSVAQLRPPRQIAAPRLSGDPREQGEEGTSGRGEQHQRHLPPDTPRLGSSPQRAPRVRYSLLRHRANRRRIPAGPHLHVGHLRNPGELQNRVPKVRSGKLRLRVQHHHREAWIGEVHGHSTLHIHDIEDARTARDHNCAR